VVYCRDKSGVLEVTAYDDGTSSFIPHVRNHMTSYPTNSDISVDPDGIRAEGERLKSLAGDFSIVADYAQDADPDWHMWGVPGIALAQLYFASADQIHTILKEFDPATSGLAQRFIDCANDYADTDEENGRGFDDIEGDIVLV
jgi:hypothetical protein